MKNKKRILIIEDEEDIIELLHFNLEQEGYIVVSATNGEKAFYILKQEIIDLIILDLMLPDIDGLDILKKIRSQKRLKNIPVIILTAKGEEIDRVLGLELGADYYVVKPFSIRELKLRIKGILKRFQQPEPQTHRWKYKGIELDREKMELYIDGQEVILTATEWNLLNELIDSKGQVLSRESLLSRVWGYDFEGYERTVDTHIRRLRVKLGPYSKLIKTIRGIGYKFKL